MTGCTVTCEGRTLELSEIELARGSRELAARLGELRQACPTARIIDDFALVPMMILEVILHGHPTQVMVDPLSVMRRLGIKSELPARLEEMATNDDAGDCWLEV